MNLLAFAAGWLAGRQVRQGREIRALQGAPPTRRERRRADARARRRAWDARRQVRKATRAGR